MNIPEAWTFKSAEIAGAFDNHVREQLPWYDLVTKSVAHIARHYIPNNGLVYDIGASTGNIGRAISGVLEQRNAKLIAIEESAEMVSQYSGPGEVKCCDAMTYKYEPFDFASVFLTMMFLPVHGRLEWFQRLNSFVRPGGAIVVVDKQETPPGYGGTVLRRLALSWKLDGGSSPDDVLRKELSLAGYQRPLGRNAFREYGLQFFQLGEFCGWLIERPVAH